MRAGLRLLAGLALGAGLLLGTGAGCGEGAPSGGDSSTPAASDAAMPVVDVEIGIHRTRAEVASGTERMARGLGGRDGLADGTGMVFAYARPGLHGFWMKDMRFDIDIVWIRGDRVVDISHAVPHDPDTPELPVIRPREPADLVLEVSAGTARRLGWKPGDPVRVDPPVRP